MKKKIVMKWRRERVGKRAWRVGKGTFMEKKGEVMGWETWHEMEKDRNLGKNAKTSRIPDVYE